MKSLLLCSIVLCGILDNVYAGKRGEDLTEADINDSIGRMQHAFRNQPTQKALVEQNTQVGETSTAEGAFYVTYRPSLGLEILKCVDKNPYPVSSVGLTVPGNGHRGLTQFFSPQEIHKSVINPLKEYQQKTQFSTERMTLFFEGMSAGAHRAVEAALYTKQHSDTKKL